MTVGERLEIIPIINEFVEGNWPEGKLIGMYDIFVTKI